MKKVQKGGERSGNCPLPIAEFRWFLEVAAINTYTCTKLKSLELTVF